MRAERGEGRETRGKREEGRGKREEGRGKWEVGRGKWEVGREGREGRCVESWKWEEERRVGSAKMRWRGKMRWEDEDGKMKMGRWRWRMRWEEGRGERADGEEMKEENCRKR